MWAPLFVLDTVGADDVAVVPGRDHRPAVVLGAGRDQPDRLHQRNAGARHPAYGYFPNGPDAAGRYGVYVDTLPKALLTAAVFRSCSCSSTTCWWPPPGLHARVARACCGRPADPLAAAKDVLAQPGPLPSLTPNACLDSREVPSPLSCRSRARAGRRDTAPCHRGRPEMRQPQSSVLPKSDPPRSHRAHAPQYRTDRGLERPAQKLAVLTWLVMVVAAVRRRPAAAHPEHPVLRHRPVRPGRADAATT